MRRASYIRWLGLPLAVVGVSAAFGLNEQFDGCRIKGNISMNSGERIYHMPSQEYYDETVISLSKGEKWFCSEDDARKAGWRKSRV